MWHIYYYMITLLPYPRGSTRNLKQLIGDHQSSPVVCGYHLHFTGEDLKYKSEDSSAALVHVTGPILQILSPSVCRHASEAKWPPLCVTA